MITVIPRKIAATSVNGVAVANDGSITLPVDSAPTTNSTNLVTSGGTKAMLDNKVNKAGDTMTGTLIMTNNSGPRDSSSPQIGFYFDGDDLVANIQYTTSKHFCFIEREASDDSIREQFYLPEITATSGAHYYGILTSKTPVTIEQGGTGATTAAAARANLGAVNKAGDTMTGNLIIDAGSNYKGILIKGASNASTVRIYNTGGAFVFDQYANGSSGGDRYLLPDIKAHDGDVWYRILTTKPNSGSLYYGTGETYSASIETTICGYVSAGTTSIQLSMWLPKSLEQISSISVTALKGALRGISGYINGWADTDILTQSGITVSAVRTTPNCIRIGIKSSSAYTNVTNNTPVAFSGKITLSFS